MSVTFPARAVENGGETRYFDYLRGKGEDVKRLKAAIVAAYCESASAGSCEAGAASSAPCSW